MVDYTDRPVATAGLRRISWGAIIAGTILILVFQLLLALLGLGIGLATVDPASNDTPSLATFSSASGIWALLTVLLATFAGAYAAARFAGTPSRRDGALHGITTWATATLVAVYVLSTSATGLVSTAFGALGSTVQSLGSTVTSLVPGSLDALPPQLRAQAEQLLQRGQNEAQQAANTAQNEAQQAANNVRQAAGTQDLGAALSEVVKGLGQDATPEQRQAAVQAISTQAGISQQEAEQRLTQFQSQYDQAVEQARQAADKAAKVASTGAFAAFVGLVLGMIVAALGGMVGRPTRTVGYYRD